MQIQANNELSGWFRFGREGVTDEEIVQVRNITPIYTVVGYRGLF
jgi:hypothetical protein